MGEVGSSPHTRDKCSDGFNFSNLVGDHPRIRGTNLSDFCMDLTTVGSSPHTRDKLDKYLSGSHTIGIIPAYAGQIAQQYKLLHLLQDHPRIRGTNFTFSSGYSFAAGSSPHTRDKSPFFLFGRIPHRIIPAYAGQIIKISGSED